MTKRFCDLCGKEIFKIQDTYRVIVDNNTDINCASDPNIVDVKGRFITVTTKTLGGDVTENFLPGEVRAV